MKKAVAIILIILPVFLMVSISLAAVFITMLVPVPVEGVEFVDTQGEKITSFEVRKGQEFELSVRVLPEMAGNQNFSLTMAQNPVLSQSEKNMRLFTATEYGSVKVIATTDEKRLQAELTVVVTDRSVDEVKLDYNELTLNIGESFKLTATVLPHTAENRGVTWLSSDPGKVSVDAAGRLYAAAETGDEPVEVTVTTLDGQKTAVCYVTVLAKLPPMAFYRIGESEPVKLGETIVCDASTISLTDYIGFDEEFAGYLEEGLFGYKDIVFRVTNGGSYCVLQGETLEFTGAGNSIRIVAEVSVQTSGGVKTAACEATFRRRAQTG